MAETAYKSSEMSPSSSSHWPAGTNELRTLCSIKRRETRTRLLILLIRYQMLVKMARQPLSALGAENACRRRNMYAVSRFYRRAKTDRSENVAAYTDVLGGLFRSQGFSIFQDVPSTVAACVGRVGYLELATRSYRSSLDVNASMIILTEV